jgi:hypothetical protein
MADDRARGEQTGDIGYARASAAHGIRRALHKS